MPDPAPVTNAIFDIANETSAVDRHYPGCEWPPWIRGQDRSNKRNSAVMICGRKEHNHG
jgi:hypothetical protein